MAESFECIGCGRVIPLDRPGAHEAHLFACQPYQDADPEELERQAAFRDLFRRTPMAP